MKRIFTILLTLYLGFLSFTPSMLSQNKVKKQKDQTYASVYGKVGVIMKNGDVKLVAKSWFMILPFSVNEYRVRFSPGLSEENNQEFLDSLESEYVRAEKSGRAFTFQTEFDGSYEVKAIPPGRYCISDDSHRKGPRNWVMISGNRSINNSFVQWDYWFELLPGQKLKLDLSNDNASSIF